jgi:hypothetical protein
MPGGQEPRSQDEMKARIAEELKGATFHVDLTAEGAIFHADTNVVEDVLLSLESRHKITVKSLTAGGKSSSAHPRFPRRGFKVEGHSYGPLIHLLNKIFEAAEKHVPGSLLRRIRFHTFGKAVDDKYGSINSLKPDIIGVIGDLPGRKVTWDDIEIVVECKRKDVPMVKQAGTYARCILLNNLRRFFALAIGFHFVTLEVFVLVYHRSGLSSSRPLKITNEDGFNGLVRHIVGILSISGEAAYRMDLTRSPSQDKFYINNSCYKFLRYLYLRGSLRGRATVVYRLNGMCPYII